MQKPRTEFTILSHVQRGRLYEMVEKLPGFNLVLGVVGAHDKLNIAE